MKIKMNKITREIKETGRKEDQIIMAIHNKNF
jgi:hypothetical protein